MSFLIKYLKNSKKLICFCSILLVLQAVFSLSVPYMMGRLINVGIQQKGVDCASPEVLTNEAMELFALVLPEKEMKDFASFYEYSQSDKIYHLRADTDLKYAKQLYENAVVSGFYMAMSVVNQDGGDMQFSSATVNMVMNFISLKMLYRYREYISGFTQQEISENYIESSAAPKALKSQIAAIVAPYFYTDAGVSCAKLQKEYIFKSGVIMAVCVILQVLCIALGSKLASVISSRVTCAIRNDYIEHTADFRKKQRKNCPHDLFSVFSADINNVGAVVNYILSTVLYAPIVSVGGVILSFFISPSLSLIVLVTVIAVISLLAVVYRIALPRYEKLQTEYSGFVRLVRSNISQLYTVRTMQTEQLESRKFFKSADEVRKNERYVLKAIFTALSVVSLISNLITAIIVVFSAKKLLATNIGIGDVIAFLQYSVITVSAFTAMATFFLFLPRAKVSFDRMREVMEVPASGKPSDAGTELDASHGHTVEFRNVTVRNYNGKQFGNISFTAKCGEITAVVAPTGCGKTTLLETLTGDGEKESGHILIDSNEIENISVDSLRRRVSYAFSDPILFTKSLRDNLLMYGADDDDATIAAALEAAAVDFIEDKDRILENAGNNFSGGQRGRIALAGALSKKAGVYIIDDCLRSVDAQTETVILEHLREIARDSAVIIVSQRIGTLMAADSIAVLTASGTQAQGTHAQLMQSSEFYRELAALQGVEVTAVE